MNFQGVKYILNRATALLLGIFIAPVINLVLLFASYHSLLEILLTTVMITFTNKALGLFSFQNNTFWKKAVQILGALIMFTLAFFAAQIVFLVLLAPIATGLYILIAPFVLAGSIIRGVYFGLTDGLNGFLHTIKNGVPMLAMTYFGYLKRNIDRWGESRSSMEAEAQEATGGLDLLKTFEPKIGIGISEEYLRNLKQFMSRIQPDELNENQQQIHLQLKDKLERYEELQDTLTAVRSKNYPDDQIMLMMDVKEPALFYKEYLENDNWYVVPASSRLTDMNNWKEYKGNTHPLFNDSLSEPAPWHDKITRYQWHPLENGQSTELQNLAMSIQTLYKQLSPSDAAKPAAAVPFSTNIYRFQNHPNNGQNDSDSDEKYVFYKHG